MSKKGYWQAVAASFLAMLTCLAGSAKAQDVPQEKPLLAEQAFKNVQVLRGMSVKEFMETMGFFAASLNANCTTCHGEGS